MTRKAINLKTKDNTIINVVQLGSGAPKILLISGIHGDERIGSQVLEMLIRNIETQKVKGTVDIIKVANPKAYQASQRLHPDDHKDLNRHFPSTGYNSPTDNLAEILAEFALNHELVIDLHAFPNQVSPLVGVLLNEGSKEKLKKSSELLRLLRPDVIWFLNAKKTEPQKTGSICSLVLGKNISAFGLELPPDDLISQDQIKRTVEGLKAILTKLNVIGCHQPVKVAGKIPVYERQVYKSLDDGQFTPQKNILTRVYKNEIIGKITSQQTGRIKEVYSPINSILLTVSKERQVKRGEKLFVLGKKFFGHFY